MDQPHDPERKSERGERRRSSRKKSTASLTSSHVTVDVIADHPPAAPAAASERKLSSGRKVEQLELPSQPFEGRRRASVASQNTSNPAPNNPRLSVITTTSANAQLLQGPPSPFSTHDPEARRSYYDNYQRDRSPLAAISNFVERDAAPVWGNGASLNPLVVGEGGGVTTWPKRISLTFVFLGVVMVMIVLALLFPVAEIVFEGLLATNQSKSSLFGLTFGLVKEIFKFLWKFIICYEIFPKTLRPWEKVLYPVAGSLIHIAFALIVRMPEYLLYGEKMTFQLSFTSKISYFVVYHLLDFVALPVVFYFLNQYHGPDSNAAKSLRENTRVATVYGLLTSVFLWVVVWCFGVFTISFFDQGADHKELVMMGCTWIPFAPLAAGVVIDSRREKRLFSFSYLIAFLWLVEIVPYFAGSYIASVLSLTDLIRFLASLGYIILLGVFLFLARCCSKVMFDGENTVFLLFPFQFFENFFGALFFLTSFGTYFVPTLVFLLIWIILRNSGLLSDFLHYLGNNYRTLSFLHSGEVPGRILLLNQAKLSFQYFLSDTLTNVCIPVIFYIQLFIYQKISPELVDDYKNSFGIKEGDITTFILLFVVILASRILATLLTIGILKIKYYLFNKKCDQYNVRKLSLFNAIWAHMTKYLLYFGILAIHIIIVCMGIFDTLFAIQLSSNVTDVTTINLQAYWTKTVSIPLGQA